MKTVVMIILFGLSLTYLNAQNFQGVATYKTKRKLDLKLDSTGINKEMQGRVYEMLIKQFEKEYSLTFNKEESVYKENEKLSTPNPSGMQMVFMDSGGSDILYKNIKDKKYTNQNDLMGKIFLVKDTLEKPKWELTNETKFIGNYTCYKAILTREAKDLDYLNKHEKSELENKTTTITINAWYTPEIPISNGPSTYWGLPGLILEVNDGEETIICSKIVMNPTNKIVIKEPSQGKTVSQNKYDEISTKKIKEMIQRNQGRRGDGNHNHVEIRIGG